MLNGNEGVVDVVLLPSTNVDAVDAPPPPNDGTDVVIAPNVGVDEVTLPNDRVDEVTVPNKGGAVDTAAPNEGAADVEADVEVPNVGADVTDDAPKIEAVVVTAPKVEAVELVTLPNVGVTVVGAPKDGGAVDFIGYAGGFVAFTLNNGLLSILVVVVVAVLGLTPNVIPPLGNCNELGPLWAFDIGWIPKTGAAVVFCGTAAIVVCPNTEFGGEVALVCPKVNVLLGVLINVVAGIVVAGLLKSNLNPPVLGGDEAVVVATATGATIGN